MENWGQVKGLKKVEGYWNTARSNLKQNVFPGDKQQQQDAAHSYRWAATEVKVNGAKGTAQTTIMIGIKKEQSKE